MVAGDSGIFSRVNSSTASKAGRAIAAWPAMLALLLAGCATVTGSDPYASAPMAQHLQREDDVGRCARLLREADRHVEAAGVRDAMAPRVPGFPYLRTDRLTAALAARAQTPLQFGAWAQLMAQHDLQARRLEAGHAGRGGPPLAAQEACRRVVAVADDGPDQREALRQAAVVPDDYSLWMRTLGLYPLTRLAFAAGVEQWQRETRAVFELPVAQLPQLGRIRRYAPATAATAVPAHAQAEVLGLPSRSDAQLRALISRHAPLLDVDTASDADRIGALRWGAAATPVLIADTTEPVAYVRLAHALVGNRAHLQIVYTFWFPARPPAGSFDVLAGALDGLVWRVTLDHSGEPLVYDSIHPCGCYHKFFATTRVQPRPPPRLRADGTPEDDLDETLFMPQPAVVEPGAGQRVLLRLEARTHYLQRVQVVPQAASLPDTRSIAYTLRDDDELRSLPHPGGRRSAFNADGLVPGTERAERYYFWPMGIASAGQMRQWGRHATAFVGRRHFDDPYLVDRYFVLREAPAPVAVEPSTVVVSTAHRP